MCRDPDTAANIRAEAEDGATGSEESGLATRGSSRGSRPVVRVDRLAVDRVAAAEGDHGLGHVGQAERDGVELLQSPDKAAVPEGRLADVLCKSYGGVVTSNIETFLTVIQSDSLLCCLHPPLTLTEMGRPYSGPLSHWGTVAR